MENNKTVSMKKFLFVIYLCIGWFLANAYTFIEIDQDKKINSTLIVLFFIVTTGFYYICKNWVLRLLAMIAAVIGLTVLIGYVCSLTVFAAFAVIYVYKSSIAEDNANEIINYILLGIASLAAIVGLIINFQSFIERIIETWLYLAVFVIAFFIFIKCSGEKKSKKKLEKIRKKDREIEKNMETMRKTVFIISVVGVLSTAASYKYIRDNGALFFSWFCFILMLIYENDKSMMSAVTMLVNKLKAFVE